MNALTPRHRATPLQRPRRALLLAPAIALALASALAWAPAAHAEATVSKFSLVISADPSKIDPKDFNEQIIGRLNDNVIVPKGLEPLGTIKFGWLFDAEGRYFVRPNVAISAGVGQLKSIVKQEYLPQLNASIQYRAEVLSVPVHLGGDYYLPPYNQGDFQARLYLGAGMTSLVYNRARFQAVETGTDTSSTLGGNYKVSAKRDSPGYYLETGVHMFFASRFSVILGALYRSAKIRDMVALVETHTANGLVRTPLPSFPLDVGGLGGRFAIGIGF